MEPQSRVALGDASSRRDGDASRASERRWRLQHITSLDGLRAIAVTLVLLAHTGHGWAFSGAFGVDVFFVLSGFLITSILLKEYAGRGALDFRRFYVRRALRLYPPLVLALILFLPFHRMLFDQSTWQTAGHYAKTAGLALLYVGNIQEFKDEMGAFAHFWSLAVEEQFYLVWPVLLLGMLILGKRRRGLLVAMTCACAAASLALNIWSTQPARGKSMYLYQTLLPTRAWELLLGCLLAIALHGGMLQGLRGRSWWSPVGFLGLAVIAASVWHFRAPEEITDEFFRQVMRTGTLAVTAGALLVVVSLCMDERGLFPRLLSLRPMVWTGQISYGLYVYHYPIYHIVRAMLPEDVRTANPAWVTVLQFVLTFAVAGLSHALWERRFLQMKGTRPLAVGSMHTEASIVRTSRPSPVPARTPARTPADAGVTPADAGVLTSTGAREARR